MGLSVTRIADFLRWWRDELVSLLPGKRLSKLFNRGVQILVCANSHSSIELRKYEHGASDAIEVSDTFDIEAKPIQPEIAKFSREKNAEITLALPSELVAQKRIAVPLVPDTKIAQMVRFEMERLTPFKSEDVCFDFKVVKKDEQRKRLLIDLYVTSGSEVDFWQNHLRSAGVTLSRITTLENDQPATSINLLAPGSRVVNPRLYGLQTALVFTVVALLAANIGLPFFFLNSERQRLSTEVAALRQRVHALEQLRSNIHEQQESLEFTRNLTTSAAMPINVIYELTKRIPDHTWIYEFDFTPSTVRVSGLSEDASSLVTGVETSDLFETAEFPSAVVRDQSGFLEQFQMQIDLIYPLSNSTAH